MNLETLTIESLAPSGHGIADNGWYILGAFPEDLIRAKPYKTAEEITYAEIIEIITPSPHRNVTPISAPFFNANAPWEYLDEEFENFIKKELVLEIFKKNNISLPQKVASQARLPAGQASNDEIGHKTLASTHYRNKAAYSFMLHKDKLEFALYTRGTSGYEKIVQGDNLLVHSMINQAGKKFLEFFNQKNVPLDTLKYLILRYSYHTNSIVAHILVSETNRKKLPWKKSDLETFIERILEVQGILVSHSEPSVRSTLTTKDFYAIGNIDLTEAMAGKMYYYHPSQFFQIYPQAFSRILHDVSKVISQIPDHGNYEVLDLFAGVGVIGLHVANLVKTVHGIEYSPLAGKYALENSKMNNIHNFEFTEADVDTALEYIRSGQILIVDPPRSGLSKASLEKIIEVQPEHIIYISCNPETQAEDYLALKEYYDIEQSYVYNIFPKTPHIEHMMFLKKKTKV